MAVPELDLARIHHWAELQVPERVRDRIRVAAEVDGHRVTIVESQPSFRDEQEWMGHPIARLRYTGTTGKWTLYWRDRNLNFHPYKDTPATPHVQEILDFLGEKSDPLFWG